MDGVGVAGDSVGEAEGEGAAEELNGRAGMMSEYYVVPLMDSSSMFVW